MPHVGRMHLEASQGTYPCICESDVGTLAPSIHSTERIYPEFTDKHSWEGRTQKHFTNLSTVLRKVCRETHLAISLGGAFVIDYMHENVHQTEPF
jgi:hypothetical protein